MAAAMAEEEGKDVKHARRDKSWHRSRVRELHNIENFMMLPTSETNEHLDAMQRQTVQDALQRGAASAHAATTDTPALSGSQQVPNADTLAQQQAQRRAQPTSQP